MRVLALGRDTSQLAAFAGGTLGMLADRGDDVFLAVLPANAEGDDAERDRVGTAVAGAIGAEWLGSLPISGDEDGREIRDPLVDALRRARPEAVLVPPAEDGERMPIAELLFNAAYCSTIPNYISPQGLDAASVRAEIFTFDHPRNHAALPDAYVDITDCWPRKVELLALCCSASDGDVTDVAEVVSRARGVQVQLEFAEAFCVERAWGRLRATRWLP